MPREEGGTSTGQGRGYQRRRSSGGYNITFHPATAGMSPKMAAAVTLMLQASGGRVWIVSGFRSRAQQEELYRRYLNGTGNLAAKPGTSLHESGFAVDFGGDLKWVAANAKRFGLVNSVRGEPWHYSLAGTEGGGSGHGHGGGTAGAGGGTTEVMAAAGPSGPPTLAKNASEAEIVKFIEENYGPSQIALLKVPELRAALIKAAQQGMVGDRFMVEIQKTRWWKDRTEAQRQWDMLELTDPKTAKRRIEERIAALAGQWEAYGVDVDIAKEARNIERLGLTDVEVQRRVAGALAYESAARGLDEGSVGDVSADRLMQIARMEYLTPVDRQTAERWAIRAIRTGEDVEEAWRSYLAGISAQRFGVDAASGITPADVLAPVKVAIAESLEISPEEIDLLDGRYKEVLQVETENGRLRPMTAYEATKWARSQAEFVNTKTAQDQTAGLVEQLGNAFGLVKS